MHFSDQSIADQQLQNQDQKDMEFKICFLQYPEPTQMQYYSK
jgi:hypothetical protein